MGNAITFVACYPGSYIRTFSRALSIICLVFIQAGKCIERKFYSNVKKGAAFFEANHQAKLDFLADESISNVKKSPYYWASFVYYGTLENQQQPNHYLTWFLVFFGLIALVLLMKFSKKKTWKTFNKSSRKTTTKR